MNIKSQKSKTNIWDHLNICFEILSIEVKIGLLSTMVVLHFGMKQFNNKPVDL